MLLLIPPLAQEAMVDVDVAVDLLLLMMLFDVINLHSSNL
jgi:hypothetical protein